MSENAGYILTEIWNAKPAWIALSPAERQTYFDEQINPFLGELVAGGAEILGCAVNNNQGAERIGYRYMAVWKCPDQSFSDRLEAGAKERGFLDYFDQVNFSGHLIPPPMLNEDMIGFVPEST